MRGQTSWYNKIDQRLVGPSATFGDRQIQPVAHLSGWQWGNGRGANGGGAFVQLRPVAVLVHEHGATRTVPGVDPDRAPVRGRVWVAAFVMVFCGMVMAGARWWAQPPRPPVKGNAR